MIPELNIVKLVTGVYEAYVQINKIDLVKPSIHSSISEAVAEIGNNIPENIATFMVIYFAGVTSGTTSVYRMKNEPEEIAAELVALAKAVEFDWHQRERAPYA